MADAKRHSTQELLAIESRLDQSFMALLSRELRSKIHDQTFEG